MRSVQKDLKCKRLRLVSLDIPYSKTKVQVVTISFSMFDSGLHVSSRVSCFGLQVPGMAKALQRLQTAR